MTFFLLSMVLLLYSDCPISIFSGLGGHGLSFFILGQLLAPLSGALRISAYRDFQSNPLIAFRHLSLSIVIRNNASRPRQINVD